MYAIDLSNEASRQTLRRLLLAKQLYLHGLDHTNRAGALNKMIGIHNFHNAIEITLRSILLHHEIRPEKQLNIEFETMLNEIDKFEKFQSDNIRLPYRQELRNLNQLRNWAQHHAVEPETSTMEDWRVFTKRFLKIAFDTYFGVAFENISALDRIQNESLRKLLELSQIKLQENLYGQSIALADVALSTARSALLSLLPKAEIPSSFTEGYILHFDDFNKELSRLTEYSIVLSSGVSIADYRRYHLIQEKVHYILSDVPRVSHEVDVDANSVAWVINFVIDTLVNWQYIGLEIQIPLWRQKVIDKLLSGGFQKFLTQEEILTEIAKEKKGG